MDDEKSREIESLLSKLAKLQKCADDAKRTVREKEVQIEGLEKKLDAFRRFGPQWQPAETAPTDGTEVIVLTERGAISASYTSEDGSGDGWDGSDCTRRAWGSLIGWMPMPEKPKVSE